MAFVNERIPAEDVEKYGLAEIDESVFRSNHNRAWTIDRERNIYLRQVATPYHPDESSDRFTQWTFFWKGTLLWFERRMIDFRGEQNNPYWLHFKVSKFEIPESLKAHREEIYNDLREAVSEQRAGGVYAPRIDCGVQVDIEG